MRFELCFCGNALLLGLGLGCAGVEVTPAATSSGWVEFAFFVAAWCLGWVVRGWVRRGR